MQWKKKAFDVFVMVQKGDLRIEVLGPLVTEVAGKPALRFLGNPPKAPRVGHESLSLDEEDFKGHSASHTINGHSIVFRLVYGGFSYLFTDDLNDEASGSSPASTTRDTSTSCLKSSKFRTTVPPIFPVRCSRPFHPWSAWFPAATRTRGRSLSIRAPPSWARWGSGPEFLNR